VVAATERELRLALMKKMITNFDYLPLRAQLAAAEGAARYSRKRHVTKSK
jgi:hypothetical protein